MPYFLDVGAVRVQDWILATPELDHLRGASLALAQVTSSAEITRRWLTGAGLTGCAIAAEAGDKDGVVVVTCPDAATAHHASLSLLRHLRTELPRVAWAGWWTEGASYLAAHLKADEDADDVHRITSFPNLYDLPVLDQCEGCRQEPKVGAGNGRDCAARLRYAAPPEHLVHSVTGKWPATFDDLAARGGLGPAGGGAAEALGRGDSRNHLALVKADGNKVGQVFAEIAHHAAALPELTLHAVSDLAEATTVAVERAATHPLVTDADAAVRGVLPHYVGGDDVLVSVPAARAWRFAAELGRQFDALRGTWRTRLARDLPSGADEELRRRLDDLIDQVSLGIGVVFARASYPIAAANKVADVALREAKRAAGGAYSAIAWVDLSAEGVAGARRPDGAWNQVISAREALSQLDANDPVAWAATADLFSVPPAGRARLAQELRESNDAGGAAIVAVDWCAATDRSVALRQLAASDPYALLSLVSRARWWPTASVEEAKR